MATHASVLAWRIPGTEEPGGLPSMGSHSRTRLKRLSSKQNRNITEKTRILFGHPTFHPRFPPNSRLLSVWCATLWIFVYMDLCPWIYSQWLFSWFVIFFKKQTYTTHSPLDHKEIKLLNPKGNQHWIFIGKTDAESETPILWPPNANSQLVGKDPDAGKDWRQKKKGLAEDEMVR